MVPMYAQNPLKTDKTSSFRRPEGQVNHQRFTSLCKQCQNHSYYMLQQGFCAVVIHNVPMREK